MDQARYLAGDILHKITQEGAFSGPTLDKALSSSDLTEQDKHFVTELVYGSLTHLIPLDEIINLYSKIKTKKLEHVVLTTLRIAVYQIKYLQVPDHAAVDEAVKILRKKNPRSAGFANGVLRSILRDEKALPTTDAFTYALPQHLVDHFMGAYGKDRGRAIMVGLLQSPPLSIRLNPLKTTGEEFRKLLEDRGLTFQPGWFHPDFFQLNQAGHVQKLPGYQEGFFSVQNEAAALPAMVLEELVEAGDVLDLCAAPGGKSAYLKERRQDLNIHAFDLAANKLPRMAENFKRLGLDIAIGQADALAAMPQWQAKAAGVLADLPCSGLGLLAKKPDIRHRIQPQDLKELARIQAKILDRAADYLAPAGILVYSTCTLNPGENEDQVLGLLKRRPDLAYDPTSLKALVQAGQTKGFQGALLGEAGLTILPGQGLDGFFISVLKKAGN